METAFSWVGQLAEWLGQFVPRLRIVRTTHCGIKWVYGSRLKIVEPGLTIFWPLVTEFIEYPKVRQGAELREQTVVTTDNRTVVVGGVLVYEVGDMALLIGQTYSPDDTVKEIALTVVHDVCCQVEWSQLHERQRKGTLDTELRNEANKALKTYGVTVVKLMLTDLAPCRVLRVVQTPEKRPS